MPGHCWYFGPVFEQSRSRDMASKRNVCTVVLSCCLQAPRSPNKCQQAPWTAALGYSAPFSRGITENTLLLQLAQEFFLLAITLCDAPGLKPVPNQRPSLAEVTAPNVSIGSTRELQLSLDPKSCQYSTRGIISYHNRFTTHASIHVQAPFVRGSVAHPSPSCGVRIH